MAEVRPALARSDAQARSQVAVRPVGVGRRRGSARLLLMSWGMLGIILLGLISVAWTAYELGRNMGFVRRRAAAWDHHGRPIEIIEIVEDARIPGRLNGFA